jgi:dolichol-phosphate mannosyltransferase
MVPHISLDARPASHRDSNKAEARRGKVFVVLPAYNEQIGLQRLLPKIQRSLQRTQLDYEIIVVDDASIDETGRVASQASFEMPLRLVAHRENRGLAGAIKTGLETAMGLATEGDVIVSMDADDTHAPANIPQMLQMIDEGYDVVIASRYQHGSQTVGVPWNRQAMTHVARWLFKLVMPIRGVRDYTCGYRAYRFTALDQSMRHYKESFFTEKGFSCMVDILLKMRGFGFVFGEVPMLLRYDHKPTESKMDVAGTARQTLSLLFRRRLGW